MNCNLTLTRTEKLKSQMCQFQTFHIMIVHLINIWTFPNVRLSPRTINELVNNLSKKIDWAVYQQWRNRHAVDSWQTKVLFYTTIPFSIRMSQSLRTVSQLVS